ncbi:MAG: hypothetical protein WD063_14160 [Pirellulales bacterium]
MRLGEPDYGPLQFGWQPAADHRGDEGALDTSWEARAELKESHFAALDGPLVMFDYLKSFGGALGACAGLMVLLAGCGISRYDSLLEHRVASLRGEARFRHLYAATQLPGTPISIRLPMVFKDSYQENSAHKEDGAVISPDRLQPPFLKLPGFKLCYEGTNDTGGARLPFYCYLAALPARPGDADKLASQLQAQLKKSFPQTPDEWQAVDANSPSGFSVHWRKIRVEGEQPFRVRTAQQLESQNLPGIFELWIHDADDYVVLVGWRTPGSIEGPSSASTTDAGSLENLLEGPPRDAKPDLGSMPAATAGTLLYEKAAQAE